MRANNCAAMKIHLINRTKMLHFKITKISIIIDSRVQGLETDHVHTFALYIEPSAVNIAPFNTSYYHFPGYTTAGREVVQRLESLSSRQQVKRRS